MRSVGACGYSMLCLVYICDDFCRLLVVDITELELF